MGTLQFADLQSRPTEVLDLTTDRCIKDLRGRGVVLHSPA
jgi:hypothetical protein